MKIVKKEAVKMKKSKEILLVALLASAFLTPAHAGLMDIVGDISDAAVGAGKGMSNALSSGLSKTEACYKERKIVEDLGVDFDSSIKDGALIGAAGGAALGALKTGDMKGAVIGGVLGFAAGGGIAAFNAHFEKAANKKELMSNVATDLKGKTKLMKKLGKSIKALSNCRVVEYAELQSKIKKGVVSKEKGNALKIEIDKRYAGDVAVSKEVYVIADMQRNKLIYISVKGSQLPASKFKKNAAASSQKESSSGFGGSLLSGLSDAVNTISTSSNVPKKNGANSVNGDEWVVRMRKGENVRRNPNTKQVPIGKAKFGDVLVGMGNDVNLKYSGILYKDKEGFIYKPSVFKVGTPGASDVLAKKSMMRTHRNSAEINSLSASSAKTKVSLISMTTQQTLMEEISIMDIKAKRA